MGAVKRVILFAAGLIITVGLIYIGFDMFQGTKRLAQNINSSVYETAQKMEEEHITKHANTFISGALVVSYVEEIYEDVQTIHITPLGESTYNAKNVSEATLYQEMKTISSPKYIDPFKNFYVTLGRNDNGLIITVTITEQEE